jgi:hypothetical protein
MKRLIAVAFLLSAITAATAGYKSAYNVSVDTTYRHAYGSLGKARNSADSVQYIGCSSVSHVGYVYATCWARDAAGTYGSCLTEDADLIQATRSLPSDGYLSINWDASSNCTQIIVYNASYYEPKQ